MNGLFLHGWGFDAGFWAPLRHALPELAGEAADRGYFGEVHSPAMAAAFVAIGHSLGAMLAVGTDAQALIAINGFDRYVAAPGRPGVPTRVVERMERRLAEGPDALVAQFRAHLGETMPVTVADPSRLRDDLVLLREGDAGGRIGGRPLLVLHGGDDPLLSAAHRDAAFADAARVERRTLAGAGHLLPLTHPDWCARHIRDFLRGLA